MGFYIGFPEVDNSSPKEEVTENDIESDEVTEKVPGEDDIDPDQTVVKNGTDNFLKIYFKTQIIFRKSDRSFKLEDLFGVIGGFVGIFVGFSLMDLIVAFKKSLQVIPPKVRKLTSPNLKESTINP